MDDIPVPLHLDEVIEMRRFIDLVDHLMACQATWLKGYASLEDTVYSCIYMKNLASFSSYNLLHSYCGVTAATCDLAGVLLDEDKFFLAKFYSAKEAEDFMRNLGKLEDEIRSNLNEESSELKLYDAVFQRILFRKFLYSAQKAKMEPVAQEYIASCKNALEAISGSEEFLKSTHTCTMGVSEILEERTTASGCKPIGFRKCEAKILSWKEALEVFKKVLDLMKKASSCLTEDFESALDVMHEIRVGRILGLAYSSLLKDDLDCETVKALDNLSDPSYDDEDTLAAPVPLSRNKTIEMECVIDFMDHLIACQATWHNGEALVDTVYSCIYMKKFKDEIFLKYNLLYSFCGVAIATCRSAAISFEEKDYLAKSCNAEEDANFVGKLGELEHDIRTKLVDCQEPYLKELYNAALQRILLQKFFYFALDGMKKPIRKDGDATQNIDSCMNALKAITESQQFLQPTRPIGVSEIVEKQTTASGCKPIGFRMCAVQILSWKQAINHFAKLLGDLKRIFSYRMDGADLKGAIRIAVDFGQYKPNGVALNHLKLILVRDGKLYGSHTMMSVILKASLLSGDLKENKVVLSEYRRLEELLVELLDVLCEGLVEQRASLEKIAPQWIHFISEFRSRSDKLRSSRKKRDCNISNSIGHFIEEQTEWIILQVYLLGFKSKLYIPSDYAMVYYCLYQSHGALYNTVKNKYKVENHEAKFFSCYYFVSLGIFKVVDYLQTSRGLFLCENEAKRFKTLFTVGFEYKHFKAGNRASGLGDLTDFDSACKTIKAIESHFKDDNLVRDELKKLKTVVEYNSIAVKTIAKLQTSDAREISLEFKYHPHFPIIRVK